MNPFKLLSLLFVFMAFSSVAQDINPCGTDIGRSEWLKKFQAGEIPVNRSSGDWLVVPIQIHITGEDNGGGYTSAALVGESVRIMNQAFEQAEIQFFLVGEYNYIDNSTYHNHSTFNQGRAMMTAYNVDDAINIYVCADAAGNCGYYTPGRDAIAINNQCLDPVNHTLAHEMGHLLSLPHPFVGWEGVDYDDSSPTPNFIGGRSVEKTDGSNCEDASDGFCQTPPDYLSYRWPCNNNGESNLVQYDPDEVPFQSRGDIIMSYSTGDCRTTFSDDQIEAMCANITDLRSDLLEHNRPYKPLSPCDRVELKAPAQLDSVQFDQIQLSWAEIPYVDYYQVQVATNINFTNLVFDLQLNDTTVVVPALDNGRNYFWRVDAYAAHSPCVSISAKKWFYTYDFSQTFELENDRLLKAYMDNGLLRIRTENFDLQNADISLYNLAGQSVLRFQDPTPTSELELATSDLQRGIYILHIKSDGVNVVTKVFN